MLENNLESVISDPETVAQDIINQMFGEDIVLEVKPFVDSIILLIEEIDWNSVDWNAVFLRNGLIGIGVGVGLAFIVGKIAKELGRDKDFPEINPDPANGCGCLLAPTFGTIGFTIGSITELVAQIASQL